MTQGGETAYLDLLALDSELIGEHPVHKVFRLRDMGVPLADGMAEKLQPESFSGRMFHSVTFEYLRDKEASGVIAEVFPDGTFLVIAPEVPPEWRSDGEVTVSPLDIRPGTRVRYTPLGEDGFRIDSSPDHRLDAVVGPALSLDDGGGPPPDDGFSRVVLRRVFPFMGTECETIFVESDGHITLRSGDGSSVTRDAARHIGGPPGLSPLLTDLDPGCAGKVYADVRSDGVTVTWKQVAHIQRGVEDGCGPGTPTNTVQAVLNSNGTIDYVYGELDLEMFARPGGNRETVIGIAAGNAGGQSEGQSEGQSMKIDLTGDLPLESRAAAIFEEYRPGLEETHPEPAVPPTNFHVDPRALSARHSVVARQYEHEILALDFEAQRYPAASQARQQCAVHQESRRDGEYTQLLASVGYRFSLMDLGEDREAGPGPFGARLISLLRQQAGEGVRYFRV